MAGIVDMTLKNYIEGAIFTAVDIETTGLDPKFDRIVEIGAIKFDKKGIIARFSTLINPGIPMPAEAAKVNNITDEMLAGQPDIKNVLPDFLYFVKKSILAAHNAAFDFGFINESLNKYGETGSNLPNTIVDTLVMSREVFAGKQSYSLQKLVAGLGIRANDAHRAEDDARLCMEILKKCIETAGQNNPTSSL